MDKINNSLSLISKIAFRNKIVWILFTLSIIYNIYLFYAFFTDEYNPGMALKQSAFTVQGIILISIIIGIQLNKIEEEGDSINLFRSIHRAMFFKEIGKILFFLCFSFIYILINYIIFVAFLISFGVEFSEFYVSSFLYLLLYWGFSFLIGGVIGYFLSTLIKGRLIYIVALFIWLLVSPMNGPILTQISVILNIEAIFHVINILNIGQSNPNYPYNTFYGFPLEAVQWIQRSCTFLVWLLLTLFVIYLKKPKNKLIIGPIIIVSALLSLTIISLTDKSQVLHYDREVDAINKQDSMFYENQNLTFSITNEQFQITGYNIDLKTKKKLNAHVKIDFKNISNEKKSKITMLLYHDLKVSSVKDSKNNAISFKQEKDVLTVQLNELVEPDNSISLVFDYGGISSPFFITNEQAIYLPNHYPWIPIIKPVNIAMLNHSNETYKLPLQPSNSISFKLNVDREDIFTNLQKKSNNNWNGTTNNGLYIVSGNFEEIVKNDKSILIPRTFEKSLNDFDNLDSEFNSLLKQIHSELNLKGSIELKRYIFLEHALSSESLDQQIWIHGDTIFITPHIVYYINNQQKLDINRNHIAYALVAAATWKKDGLIVENLIDLRLFNYSYAYFINTREANFDPNKFEYLDVLSDIADESMKENELRDKVLSIKMYINNKDISEKEKIEFFANWYEALKEKDTDYLNKSMGKW